MSDNKLQKMESGAVDTRRPMDMPALFEAAVKLGKDIPDVVFTVKGEGFDSFDEAKLK